MQRLLSFHVQVRCSENDRRGRLLPVSERRQIVGAVQEVDVRPSDSALSWDEK